MDEDDQKQYEAAIAAAKEPSIKKYYEERMKAGRCFMLYQQKKRPHLHDEDE